MLELFSPYASPPPSPRAGQKGGAPSRGVRNRLWGRTGLRGHKGSSSLPFLSLQQHSPPKEREAMKDELAWGYPQDLPRHP